ncbi:MAG: hypothetical protein COW24_03470 [Candidatus Kerfeldbacteria bacterium CG15_BIG_FIL_POST_REV_8_21_14_020_45_12]|uniref:DUF4064 domain-containing protein n=1 Tax=Candidatus Kerfeldbacteria bacterium CG15_BIG_FIL_POST_REV_8_21_14_020_45_12 TaxID=2014247 RepID=A0A2M7H3J0_9BACT|nr:MAG: hypothetical protein COW24_03470 [Candidatus Kerfeldbacteria bacterium CG15_BIG_FIL_POST_REV_8_21_14_020_45_12]PJA93076.1 MAG: hypothetical protein CO132_04985 [Candidatus Kerfeldbacteria bacterium CG_4_9_14_3_um_filter_45_8]
MDSDNLSQEGLSASVGARVPRQIVFVRVLTILQMVLAAAFIFLVIWMVDYTPTSDFGEGFRSAVTLDSDTYSYEDAGAASSGSLLAIIIGVIVLVSLVRRTRRWTIGAYVAVGIQIVIGISSFSLPLLPIISAVVLASPKAREYLNFGKLDDVSKAPGRSDSGSL